MLQLVELVRVRRLGDHRLLVVGLEGPLDLFGVVDEVEDEGVLLAGRHAVQPRQRLHRLDARSLLSTYIVCSSGWSKPVWYLFGHEEHLVLVALEPLGQLASP